MDDDFDYFVLNYFDQVIDNDMNYLVAIAFLIDR